MNLKSENSLLQMLKIGKAALRAGEMQDKTLVYHRKEVLDEAVSYLRENPDCPVTPFGVKNTGQINSDLVAILRRRAGFLFHTIDKMAERGRAIDPELINPLTGRVMTGSSSGSCLNILYGINDFALGTDGGGSVLGPAVATGLYSIMGKGLGLRLQGNSPRISTDRIDFIPGIGVISHSYELCKTVISSLTGVEAEDPAEIKRKHITIAIPTKGSVSLPNGRDMRKCLEQTVSALGNHLTLVEKDLSGINDRRRAIDRCNEIFQENIDFILTMEGPVDLLGTGDSVLGVWGRTGSGLQDSSGKYLLKAANMMDATALSIPSGELATGFLLLGGAGREQGSIVMALGEIINALQERPPLFTRYFTEGYQQEDKGFI